jgi:hypothetical protein
MRQGQQGQQGQRRQPQCSADNGAGGGGGGGALATLVARLSAATAAATATATPSVKDSRSFDPSLVKAFDQSAIDALLEATRCSRPRFLDKQFQRVTRGKRDGPRTHRSWYFSVDVWLAASGAMPEADAEAEAEVMKRRRSSSGSNCPAQCVVEVAEDADKLECAISGEPLERVYDRDADKWFYTGAVVLHGEAAAHQGVRDGAIVKVYAVAGDDVDDVERACFTAKKPKTVDTHS